MTVKISFATHHTDTHHTHTLMYCCHNDVAYTCTALINNQVPHVRIWFIEWTETYQWSRSVCRNAERPSIMTRMEIVKDAQKANAKYV